MNKHRRGGCAETPLSRLLVGMMAVMAALICTLGAVDYAYPDVISVYGESLGGALCSTEYAAVRFGAIPLKTVEIRRIDDKRLIPGGMLFGVRCGLEGVLVVGLEDVCDGCCPAKEAGVRVGDVIVALNGVPIADAAALSRAFSEDGAAGRESLLTVMRGEEKKQMKLLAVRAADGVFRAGIWSRDQTAGIGTVTFIDPDTGVFGGLGHGICDSTTGMLLPLARGVTLGVHVAQIVPGSAGTPGELRGTFSGERTGSLMNNTPCGVTGVFTQIPTGQAYPIGRASELSAGTASVLCTLEDGPPREYTIRIVSVGDPCSVSNKNFVLEITDGALLEKTGGIIQGMSGSPIIKDGKLVGAVTHVLVNDPTRGYGVFIENMLSASQLPMEKAS
ncbi:MAG: SpoIVB peptidase [Clostridia bacterium]|nr:SpoIVB peptidase [Clostridia bacterium]